jgi:hypothetical protein
MSSKVSKKVGGSAWFLANKSKIKKEKGGAAGAASSRSKNLSNASSKKASLYDKVINYTPKKHVENMKKGVKMAVNTGTKVVKAGIKQGIDNLNTGVAIAKKAVDTQGKINRTAGRIVKNTAKTLYNTSPKDVYNASPKKVVKKMIENTSAPKGKGLSKSTGKTLSFKSPSTAKSKIKTVSKKKNTSIKKKTAKKKSDDTVWRKENDGSMTMTYHEGKPTGAIREDRKKETAPIDTVKLEPVKFTSTQMKTANKKKGGPMKKKATGGPTDSGYHIYIQDPTKKASSFSKDSSSARTSKDKLPLAKSPKKMSSASSKMKTGGMVNPNAKATVAKKASNPKNPTPKAKLSTYKAPGRTKASSTMHGPKLMKKGGALSRLAGYKKGGSKKMC